ncbi:MAG: hypothetical protein HC880_07500 [Bacteroidia bacterium]|nr:hypothetical protein [Bacteroidia bacterium]
MLAYGHLWSTDSLATLDNSSIPRSAFGAIKVEDSLRFESKLTGLTPRQFFFVRVYVQVLDPLTGQTVTGYSDPIRFLTRGA